MNRIELVQRKIDELRLVHMGAFGELVRPILDNAERSLAHAKGVGDIIPIRRAIQEFYYARGILRLNNLIK